MNSRPLTLVLLVSLILVACGDSGGDGGGSAAGAGGDDGGGSVAGAGGVDGGGSGVSPEGSENGVDAGGTDPATGTAEGLWKGTSSDVRTLTGVILDSGSYWIIYSEINGDSLAGLLSGSSDSAGGEFSSADARDQSYEGLGINTGTVAGNYAEGKSLDGTVTLGNLPPTTFNLDYDNHYDQAPSVAAIAGTYVGDALTDPWGGRTRGTITIGADGSLAYSDERGCTALSPSSISQSTNGHYFEVSLLLPTSSGRCYRIEDVIIGGVAVYDGATLVIVGSDESSSRRFAFAGTR